MEIEETDIIEVNTMVINLERFMESTNMVSVFVHNLIRDFTKGESGTETQSGRSRYIRLNPHGFTPSHLSELLRGQQVNESQYVGERIALDINHSLANDKSLGERVFINVHVKFIKERRLILPYDVPAPLEVLERLVEEHRVDLKGKYEGQCSICFEDLSMSHQRIIEMPKCLHRFHQNCLFKWLSRKNSCPLCRSSVGRVSRNRDSKSF